MPVSNPRHLAFVYLQLHSNLYNNILPDKYQSTFGSGSQYAYYHEEDESTFHLVDTTRVQKPPYQRGRFRQNMRGARNRLGQRGLNQPGFQMLNKGAKSRDRFADFLDTC